MDTIASIYWWISIIICCNWQQTKNVLFLTFTQLKDIHNIMLKQIIFEFIFIVTVAIDSKQKIFFSWHLPNWKTSIILCCPWINQNWSKTNTFFCYCYSQSTKLKSQGNLTRKSLALHQYLKSKFITEFPNKLIIK